MRVPRCLATITLVAALALLAGCGGDETDPSTAEGTSAGPIAITASDDACDVAVEETVVGTVTFVITNAGTQVTEVYLYGEGDRILGEAENIGPGLTRELMIEITDPGPYEIACKPGMVGDGIRHPFTVTGDAGSAAGVDQTMAGLTASDESYVALAAAALW